MNNLQLEHQLLTIFRVSSFHAQLLVLLRLLERLGYRNLRIMGRRTPAQSTDQGGHELMSLDEFGIFTGKTVIKFVRDKVRTRMLDELAGTIRRVGADYGVLIATGGFCEGVTPDINQRVRVITGTELAHLLVRHRIGTKTETQEDTVDHEFFRSLEVYAGQVAEFVERTKGKIQTGTSAPSRSSKTNQSRSCKAVAQAKP